MLGSILLYMGELVSAREHLEQGVALYDPERLRSLTFSRATNLVIICLSRLSWALWILGYPESALARVQEALTLAQQSSHMYSIAFARYYASLIHQCRREARATQEQAETVLALSREHGFVLWSAEGLFMHGWALARQTHVDAGIEQMHQSLTTLEAMRVEIGHSSLLVMLAESYWTAGQTAAGWRVLAEARAIMDKNAEGYYAAELSRLTGEFLLQESQGQQVVDAEQHFHQALTLARRQGAKSFELRAAMSLSRLWQGLGKRVAARYLLTEIYSWFTEGYDTLDLQEAKVLLEALQ
jgi:adenylate cyclase